MIFTGCNEVVAKVIFLHLSVILFTGGCLSQCMLGYHTPLGADTPQSRKHSPPEQTPPTPPEQTPPGSRHPPEQTPPGDRHPLRQTPPQSRHPPGTRHPPLQEADSGIRSMSGRYASYWNAFCLLLSTPKTFRELRTIRTAQYFSISVMKVLHLSC